LAFWLYAVPGKELSRTRRGALVFVYLLGLLAKPMLVTLPFLLLLLDYWPLQRWRPADGKWVPPLHLWLEKAPLFVLAVASSAMTLHAQAAGGAVAGLAEASFGLGRRLANAVVSVVAYLVNSFWPRDLAVLYPYPAQGVPLWQVLGATVLLLGMTALAVQQSRRRPYVFVGWFWFLLMLAPVIGVVQIGIQSRADRYTYLPSIGLLLVVVWLVADAVVAYVPTFAVRWVAAGSALLAIGALSVACAHQAAYWQDRLTLFKRLAAAVPEYPNGHLTVGVELERRGDRDGALAAFEDALRVAPSSPDVHTNLATGTCASGPCPRPWSTPRKALGWALSTQRVMWSTAALSRGRVGMPRPRPVSAGRSSSIPRLRKHAPALPTLSRSLERSRRPWTRLRPHSRRTHETQP
jgi:hypothetical protein